MSKKFSKARRAGRVCPAVLLFISIALAAGFLLEAALPGDVTGGQTIVAGRLFTLLFPIRDNTVIRADGGRELADLAPVYNGAAGYGSVMEVYPDGGTADVTIESLDPDVARIDSYTYGDRTFHLLIASGVGTAEFRIITNDRGVRTQKVQKVAVSPDNSYTPQGVYSIHLSDSAPLAGERATVSIDAPGVGDNMPSLIFESSDNSVIRVEEWDFRAGCATVRGVHPGSAKIYAKRLCDGETVAVSEITVRDDGKPPLLLSGDGGDPASLTFSYSPACSEGDVHTVYTSGADEWDIVSLTPGTLAVIESGKSGTYYFAARGEGEAKIRCRLRRGDISVDNTYTYTVGRSEISERTSPNVTSDSYSPRAGDSFTFNVCFPDGTPEERRGVSYSCDGAISTASVNPITGVATFTARSAGDGRISIRSASSGRLLYERVYGIMEREPVETLPVYMIARKTIGHAGWCAAVAFSAVLSLLLFGVRTEILTSSLTLYGIGLSTVSESIQAFIASRTCASSDVGIDLIGFSIGLALGYLIFAITRKRKKKIDIET